jgi:glycosyltransferase involved in cell wall biosynthesis
VTLSVVIITHNEEANLGRTLKSVQSLVSDGKGEIIVVDSGSTDRTVEISKSFGATIFVEEWKGYAAQKNSAIDKATGDWVLSLDADEEVSDGLTKEIEEICHGPAEDGFGSENGYWLKRQNHFLGHALRHGGFWPDPKLRMFRRGMGRVKNRAVHEAFQVTGRLGTLYYPLIHHSYPALSDYIEHMNRYSSLGAEMVVAEANGKVRFSVVNIVLRPLATFVYNYIFRFGFLDGREGLLLHLYHAVYVSWKYSKAWESSRNHTDQMSS